MVVNEKMVGVVLCVLGMVYCEVCFEEKVDDEYVVEN